MNGAGELHHERILASAGSGKTFRLSGRAIELIRRGVSPPSLLASTFTRAAAAEIRDRVLGRLAKAVLDADARRDLAIGTGLKPPDEAEAIAALERTVQAIDRLQIRTLDSLFASTVMAFAAELGVPSEPRVIDERETADLMEAAIERMLDADDAQQLLASVASLNRGNPKLSVADAILRAVEPVLAIARQSAPEAWEWPSRPLASEEDVRAMVAELAALPQPKDRRQAKVIAGDLERLASIRPHDAEAWGALLSGGIGGKVHAREEKYYTPLSGEVIAAYEPLVAHAADLAYEEGRRRTRSLRHLADRFDAEFARVKREAGAVTFDDLTRALADASDLPDLTEIFFRLDARITHALLDEFQDTSVPQWRALRPIVREIAGGDPNERSLFVVGDLKQSIYGWRGASPALLDRLPEIALESGTLEMRDETLARSFRSSQTVLDGVNGIFDSLLASPALANAHPAHHRAAEGWLRAWCRHVSGVPTVPGTIELHIAETVSGNRRSRDQQDANLETAANVVASIVEGRPGLSVGVLCRRNRAVAGMLNRLRTRGVAASARGVGSLLDASSVNAFLAAISLADHPDDTIAAFHVGHSPLGAIVGVGADDHTGGRRESRRHASRRLRETLSAQGYARTFRAWRDELLASLDAREARRLDELIECATRFDAADARERRPAEVAAALRGVELDEEGGSGVTVMNVHQSKGLEFDAVVLCDIDEGFTMRAKLAARREEGRPDSPYVRVTRWVAEEERDEAIGDLHDATTLESYREFLSTLYVATTRARRGLIVVTGPAHNADGIVFPNSFAGILRGAWCPGERGPGRVHQVGSRAALDVPGAVARPREERPAERAPVRLREASGLRVLQATSASKRERWEDPQDGADEATLDGARKAARDEGVLVHAMLESIEWVDGAVDREALLAAGRRAAGRPVSDVSASIGRCADLVERSLASPAIGELFRTPPASMGPVEVRREWRYARIDPASGGLEQGSVDRLVLRGPPGPARTAQVFDFKTDRVEPGADETLRERYGPQLEAYRTAVAERFGLRRESVETFLVVLRTGSVLRVG